MKLLVPVDGSDLALRAVDEAIRLAADGLRLHVVLLNVQPALSADVSRFVAHEVLAEYHEEQGQQALAAARERLEAAGVAFDAEVAVGSAATTIVAQAGKLGCDGILMGSRGVGSVAGILLGSTALRVAHHAEVPVTLVR